MDPRIDSPQARDPSEQLLRGLRARVTPENGAKLRVQNMLRARLRAPMLLAQARDAITPPLTARARVWSFINKAVTPLVPSSMWDLVRSYLAPAENLRDQLWRRIGPQLEPVYAHAIVSRPVKWIAAFAVITIVVRVSPLLFLATPSVADSPVTLIATQGQVQLSLDAQWVAMTGERILRSPTTIQTGEGAATIVAHDDVVFRLGPNTRIRLLDLSDRPKPSNHDVTVSLEQGKLWVLGFVPKQVRGVTIATSQGRVVLHEGSVSIEQGDMVEVAVWNRSATVSRRGRTVTLVTGEKTTMGTDNLVAQKFDTVRFQNAWVTQNLERDAAHQKEIASLQQQRRAAQAGILPGSTLYRAKRLAENVDVFLTFDQDERARKRISQAATRLNEAAALLQNGVEGDADTVLQEYKDTLLQVASGSGGSPMVQSLLKQEVAEADAAVSAALPGDSAYALKTAVNETIAKLPTEGPKPDVDGRLLLDELDAARQKAEQGDTNVAREKLNEIAEDIASFETTGTLALLSPDVREEVKATAERVAAVIEGPAQGSLMQVQQVEGDTIVTIDLARRVIIRPLNPQQVAAKAQEIRGRIFVFDSKKAQYDALADQLRLIERHPDRGRILRELVKSLPETGLAQRVSREIRIVNAEVQQKVTTSGGVAPSN